jgi:uncharacterized protein YgiM (DUF1202 family)
MDTTRSIKLALVLGMMATVVTFFGVLRLLDVPATPRSSAAVETTQETATAAAASSEGSPTQSPSSSPSGTGVFATANAYPNVHSNFGLTSPIIGNLTLGDRVEVVGRTSDGVWLAIRFAKAPNGVGWVSTNLMNLDSPIDAIPVSTP